MVPHTRSRRGGERTRTGLRLRPCRSVRMNGEAAGKPSTWMERRNRNEQRNSPARIDHAGRPGDERGGGRAGGGGFPRGRRGRGGGGGAGVGRGGAGGG